MASKSRVSGSTARTPSGGGSAFTKDVQQPTVRDDAPEFDPTRPAAFDLGAFISGAKKHTNTRTIPVTSRPVEAAELERLTADREKLARVTDEDAQTEGGSPRRLSAISERRQRLLDVEARIAELEEELDGTWLLVKVRGLKPSEQDAVRKKRPEVGVPLFCAMFEHAGLVAYPDTPDEWGTLTADGWRELVEAIGTAQYVTLDQAVDGLTYQAVTPDFYERYSASRVTGTTSTS